MGVCKSNSDREFLEFSRELLSNLGFHPGTIRLNKSAGEITNLGKATRDNWVMNLSRFDEIRSLARVVGFADGVKQNKLEDAIRLILGFGNKIAVVEWKKRYRKVNGKWIRIGGTIASS